MKVFVIVPAAGLGTRMAPPSAAKPRKKTPTKQFKELGGVPILVHTLRKFAAAPAVYEIIVALRRDEIAGFRTQVEKEYPEILSKRLQMVEGGEHRQDSVASALARTAADPEDIVLVHDAVRPFVTPEIIANVIEAAHKHGAAIAGWPAVDTVKQVERTADGALIKATIPRASMVMAQTPQGFRYDILKKAFDEAVADGFLGTDEASLIERAGLPVVVVMGSPRNMKITTPADMELAEFYLKKSQKLTPLYFFFLSVCCFVSGHRFSDAESGKSRRPFRGERNQILKPEMRIGYGWDSHEFKPGIPLKIGGVTLPHDKGLGGHSDGDVLLHAITDALLGAIAGPDIGSLFPPSDPQWKNADSAVFLREALKRIKTAGYELVNLDSTLILSTPKIGPHADAIRKHVAELCGIPADCVGIKAKTPEGMGTENAAIANVAVLLKRSKRSGVTGNLARPLQPCRIGRTPPPLTVAGFTCRNSALLRSRRFNERAKNRLRGLRQLRPIVHTSLRMPLHRQHKMLGGGSFQSFDDSIVGGTRHHCATHRPLHPRTDDARNSRLQSSWQPVQHLQCPPVAIPVRSLPCALSPRFVPRCG